jgi:hypothetical protein
MALLSNGLRIDPVVLPVRADKPDVDNAIRIIDPHHDAKLITGNIEHRATVVENARAADGSLDVRWRSPVSSLDLPVPSHQWFARVSVRGASADESLKRTERNDPHSITLLQSHIGTKTIFAR